METWRGPATQHRLHREEISMNTTPGSLRLPSQAAPIDRTSSPAALYGAGVDPSWGLSDLWDTVAPVLGQAAQAAIPLIAGSL
jgi:hypothetical protein